jgi:hypothetical protein
VLCKTLCPRVSNTSARPPRGCSRRGRFTLYAHAGWQEIEREQAIRHRLDESGSWSNRPSSSRWALGEDEGGETRGFDVHKRVKGRKRHILVDAFNCHSPAAFVRELRR